MFFLSYKGKPNMQKPEKSEFIMKFMRNFWKKEDRLVVSWYWEVLNFIHSRFSQKASLPWDAGYSTFKYHKVRVSLVLKLKLVHNFYNSKASKSGPDQLKKKVAALGSMFTVFSNMPESLGVIAMPILLLCFFLIRCI